MPSFRVLGFALLVLTAAPQGFSQAPAEPLTEAQIAAFKEVENDFARLAAFLDTLPPSQPRDETRRVLNVMKARAEGLKTNFDPTRFDEIRWEVNFEHQQMLLWLQEPRLVPLPPDGGAVLVNVLTNQEKASGWELLFDGQSFAGWRGYKAKGVPAMGWEIKDGMIKTAGKAETGVDLITERKFTNFEVLWEWRTTPGGNGGLKYLVTEDRPSAPGHEYQILDDSGDPWRAWRGDVHRTAAFYDVVPPATDKPMRPIGKWNQSRVVVSGNRVEHWLNGANVLSYEIGSPIVQKGTKRSKFSAEPGFGRKISGHLLLTYHASETCYRNIKIRELK